MRVTLYVGPATVQVEAPQGDAGRQLADRLCAAMVAAGAVDKVITQGPAIPERLDASPAAGHHDGRAGGEGAGVAGGG